ncbi:hypothetical protein [Rhodococcus qingshengii]|uniref:hypothetical protein n=1 Tax=Rhodococcus qingshengii TaxID=334542 RepID=UPI0035D548DA
MNDIIQTKGDFRVRLEIDEHPENPRRTYDHLVNVITPKGQRFIDVDEDGGPLQYGWDHFADSENGTDKFIRWARIMHSATAVYVRPADGMGVRAIWYVMPDNAKETTYTPQQLIDSEVREYQSWAEGDAWTYIIEKREVWVPEDRNDDSRRMISWAAQDSLSGLIGRDYAEESARRALPDFLSA